MNTKINDKLIRINNYINRLESKINMYNGIKYYLDQKFKNDVNSQIFNCIDVNVNQLTIDYVLNVKMIIQTELEYIFKNFSSIHKLYKKNMNFKIHLTSIMINYYQLMNMDKLVHCIHNDDGVVKCCFECFINSDQCVINIFDKSVINLICNAIHITEDIKDINEIVITSSVFLNSNILKIVYLEMDKVLYLMFSNIYDNPSSIKEKVSTRESDMDNNYIFSTPMNSPIQNIIYNNSIDNSVCDNISDIEEISIDDGDDTFI